MSVDLRDVELAKGMKIAVETCMQVQPGEKVLVVTDTAQSRRMAEILLAQIHAVGAEAGLIIYPTLSQHSAEPPAFVAAAMREADAVFGIASKSLTHTNATKEARAAGTRIHTWPGVTEEIFLRCCVIDYAALSARLQKLYQFFREPRQAVVTSPDGTNLTLETYPRLHPPIDGICANPGEFDQIPSGLVGSGVVEGSASGTIVINGSIGELGIVAEPVTWIVEDGRIVEVQGGKDARRFQQWLADLNDPNMAVIAELGIGANPAATLTGNPAEDERIMGGIHFGIGDNARLFGGKNVASSHNDVIILGASLTMDGTPIIKDGQLLID